MELVLHVIEILINTINSNAGFANILVTQAEKLKCIITIRSTKKI